MKLTREPQTLIRRPISISSSVYIHRPPGNWTPHFHGLWNRAASKRGWGVSKWAVCTLSIIQLSQYNIQVVLLTQLYRLYNSVSSTTCILYWLNCMMLRVQIDVLMTPHPLLLASPFQRPWKWGPQFPGRSTHVTYSVGYQPMSVMPWLGPRVNK